MAAYSYINLLTPVNTGSGIADVVYIAPVRWFAPAGIKMPKPPYNVPGRQVEILDSHQFTGRNGFVKMLLAPERNTFDARTIGARETQKLEQTANLFLPGSYALQHETMMALLNEPFIALVQDSSCDAGMYYQVGTPLDFGWLKADFSTGTTREGVKGYAASIVSIYQSALLYRGAVTVSPLLSAYGDFNPADFLQKDFKTT